MPDQPPQNAAFTHEKAAARRPFKLTLTYTATLPVVWIYPPKWTIRAP